MPDTIHLGVGAAYIDGVLHKRWSACGYDYQDRYTSIDRSAVTCKVCLKVTQATIQKRLQLLRVQEIMES